MASRAKKKAIINNQDLQPKVDNVVIAHKENKWGSTYIALTIILLLLLFFMILLSPIFTADIKFSLTGSTSDAQEYNFTVTSLDVLIAPLRGCTSGFRFMLEKMGATFKTDKEYTNIVETLATYIRDENIEKINDLGINVLVNTYIFFVIFLLAVAAQILEAKLKKKGLISLIGSASLFAMVLYFFIYTLALNIKTILTSAFLNGAWGIWLILFLSMGYLAINIVNYVNKRKEKDNENL